MKIPTAEGFLLVNKPSGLSSFAIIKKLRFLTGIKKIGHAGTLDPLATGLMIVAIGKAFTTQIDQFTQLDKTYMGTATLGTSTDSYDADGKILSKKDIPNDLTLESIQNNASEFLGHIQQIPPAFSAKKVNGKRSYKLARAGKEVHLEPKDVHIYEFTCQNMTTEPQHTVDFIVKCSKGTYIRSLVHDLGNNLGIGAHLSALNRTQIGPYHIDNAIHLDDLSLEAIQRQTFRKKHHEN